MSDYRPDILPIPSRLLTLPVRRGYPVPWFVAQVDGEYDFRVTNREKLHRAIEEHRCWICGQKLGKYVAFNGGPICGFNQMSAEPPSHKECAIFAATACPFLNSKEKVRREFETAPADVCFDVGNVQELDNPDIAMVWITEQYGIRPTRVPGGHFITLFHLGDPTEIQWYKQGRPATPDEVTKALVATAPKVGLQSETVNQRYELFKEKSVYSAVPK